jgi:hypothetical protein
MALAAAGRSRRAAPDAGLRARLKSAAGAHVADAQLLPRRAFVRLRHAGSWTPAFAALHPRHRKLLAVRVRINIANSQVCRARKHAVVSAALRDLVVYVRELAGVQDLPNAPEHGLSYSAPSELGAPPPYSAWLHAQ